MTVMDAKYKVCNKVIACVDEEMMGQFYIETQPELDILASHYEVLHYMITEYKPLKQDEETINEGYFATYDNTNMAELQVLLDAMKPTLRMLSEVL